VLFIYYKFFACILLFAFRWDEPGEIGP